MEKKKDMIEIILLSIITIVLILGLIFTGIHFKKMEEKNPPETPNPSHETIEDEENPKKPSDDNSSKEDQPSNPSHEEKPVNTKPPTATPKPTKEPVPNETDVVKYFENLEVTTFQVQDENNPTFREKAKSTFTTVVDFLFYGSTIKGYTFKDHTTSAKLKVLKIALKIDSKIDSYFPNYKDTIKEKYQNLKGKAALLYLETTSKMCDAVGESACNEAREDFKNMKESFGLTWDIIKEAAGKGSTYLKTILNEWYQSIK